MPPTESKIKSVQNISQQSKYSSGQRRIPDILAFRQKSPAFSGATTGSQPSGTAQTAKQKSHRQTPG